MTNWSQIVEEHGSTVWKVARRLLGNDADAADCFQRTFLAAVELTRQQPVRHWPALLRRLATARALEQLRVRIRERGRQTRLHSDFPAFVDCPDPIEIAQANELAEVMRIALGEMDPLQAQVFCLTQLDGLSYEEVSVELGLTVNHVGVLLNRARGKLKERLAAYAPVRDNESKQGVER
jgi:RNA polymerase sigma-70 factor (ECF subfamily)